MSQGQIKDVRITQDVLQILASKHRRFLRGEAGGRRAVLKFCKLDGLDLSGLDFRDAEFLVCTFVDCDLKGADFSGAQLFSAAFDDADMAGASFERADLRAATFAGADMTGTVLDSADLRQGYLMDAEKMKMRGREGSSFRRAKLSDAKLNNSKIAKADFGGAKMDNVDLTGVDARGTSFRGADMTGSKMTGGYFLEADLRGASLVGATGIEVLETATKLVSRRPSEEELELVFKRHDKWFASAGKSGERAILTMLDLSRMPFIRRNFVLADMADCNLTGCDLSESLLIATSLRGANLEDCKLAGADIRGADLTDANLRGVDINVAKTGELPGTGLITQLKRSLEIDD